jgi:transposase-like protein
VEAVEIAGMVEETEVTSKPKRRGFTAEYKLRILREADACTKRGEIGALLRREGLYSSHLVDWRRARDSGLAPKKRGPVAKEPNPLSKRVAELEREAARWKARAEQAEGLVALQKKVAELLGHKIDEKDGQG